MGERGAGEVKGYAGVRPLFEPRQARPEQRGGGQHLPGAEDRREIGGVAEGEEAAHGQLCAQEVGGAAAGEEEGKPAVRSQYGRDPRAEAAACGDGGAAGRLVGGVAGGVAGGGAGVGSFMGRGMGRALFCEGRCHKPAAGLVL